jgi:hypothetical protein
VCLVLLKELQQALPITSQVARKLLQLAETASSASSAAVGL